jgi:transcriptional regulator with XRE-family HTH domain
MFVHSYDHIRAKARELRIEKRLTLDEIAERLAMPRTTVWYWIRDLPAIERGGRQNRGQKLGTEAMQRKFRLLREEAYETGRAEFAALCEEPTFRDFVCLYIAEGYKRNRNRVSIGNSDAAVIRLADYWIRRFATRKVTYAIQYHADQDVDELIAFWATELDVAPATIRVQRKSNSSQLDRRTWRSRHGVISVIASDTLLRARVQGWIDCLREQWLHSPGNGA